MRFSFRLLIGLGVIIVQMVVATAVQSEASPIVLPILVTLFYSGWCDSYILGFAFGSLSFMAYFLAVAVWYGAHSGISVLFLTLQPLLAAWQFYVVVTVFGLLGIISVKAGRWLRKQLTEKTVQESSTT